jgi:hypothetical protein
MTFTVIFIAGVVTKDKVKWLEAEITAFTVSQKILILSATINRISILHQSLLLVT